MKVLLINPMASRKAPIKGRAVHFPIGLGLIAASLKAEGYSVDVLDNETECLNKYELSDYLKNSDHDIVGISAMAPQYSYVKGLSRMIKEFTNKPVILGGPLSTYSHKTVLRNTDIDICVIGEGEETVVDLLENINSLGEVSGIAFRQNGDVTVTPPRTFKKTRNEYPFPAYELFNMTPYFGKQQVQYEGWGSKYLNIEPQTLKNIGLVTGIGCPYQCKFCSRSVIKPRLRSVDNIISEIKYLKNKFDIGGVRFIDDLLIINEKRTLELCEKIKTLNLVWSGQARTNTLNDRLARAMKESGCIGVAFGFESGSDRLLKAMNKRATVEDHKRALSAARDNGLSIRVQIMYGYPGENKDSIEETISFYKEAKLPQRRFNILTPLPGSALYNECLNKKTITDEDKYLEKVSAQNTGFASKKVLLNLTEMTDDEFEALLLYAERRMEENYKKIFKNDNKLWFITVAKYHLLRQLRRAKKITNLPLLKKKIESIFRKSHYSKFTREQTEELYFKL